MLKTAQRAPDQPVELNRCYDHAVVIGSGIAGLTAARVLSDFFNQVTIVERDRLESPEDFRQGVPQGRHVHTLMPRGQSILEQMFPGLLAEMAAEGAIKIDARTDIAYFQNGRWQTPQRRTTSIASSRPLLECIIRRRVMALPNVSVITSCLVDGLKTDAAGRQVTGLRLRPRRDANFNENEVTANLVIDTSGRGSKAPQWLADLGYTPPEEWRINPFVAYTSRLYQAPANFSAWKTLYIPPEPPHGTRGGIIVPMEHGRWCATLIGVAGDVPPNDAAGFEAFAQSLPAPSFYEAIKDARPLSHPNGFQRTENRVRRYDKLPRYLEGFLVAGDAAIALNPVYAQGMTAAAQSANALQQSLRAQQQQSPDALVGLAADFQQKLSQVNYRLWRIATTQDWDWPITEVTDDSED
ncbi:MAG: FAD-dependent monooxygenase [Anaerolineaceae bacterium]|nr:FAD-dependent monooxygenase [Anaerolineaceae bacterium]